MLWCAAAAYDAVIAAPNAAIVVDVAASAAYADPDATFAYIFAIPRCLDKIDILYLRCMVLLLP